MEKQGLKWNALELLSRDVELLIDLPEKHELRYTSQRQCVYHRDRILALVRSCESVYVLLVC